MICENEIRPSGKTTGFQMRELDSVCLQQPETHVKNHLSFLAMTNEEGSYHTQSCSMQD